jgi:hypothetical protein
MQPADLPRYLYQEPGNLERELDDIMSTNEVSRGVAPGDRNSGSALAILAEQNDGPLGVMAVDQANGWSHLASMVLRLYGQHVDKDRTTTVWVDGVPQRSTWVGKDLQGQWRVHVPVESTSPESHAARMAQLVDMKQNFPEVFANADPGELARALDTPGSRPLLATANADARKAIRENAELLAGTVCIPALFDDHARHISEHNRERKGRGYELASDEIRKVIDDHVLAHQRLIEEEAASQAALNAVTPGLAGLPQADAPVGSEVPLPIAESVV